MRQKMQKKLDAVNTKLDAVNTKLDDMNTKMTKMQEQTLASIRVFGDSCGISYEEAMNRIGIPETDQALYLKLLQES